MVKNYVLFCQLKPDLCIAASTDPDIIRTKIKKLREDGLLVNFRIEVYDNETGEPIDLIDIVDFKEDIDSLQL